MQTFNCIDLPIDEELVSDFMEWMEKQYPEYTEGEDSISAHDIDDANNFVTEFLNQ